MLTNVMSQAAADAIVGLVAATFQSSETSAGTLSRHLDAYITSAFVVCCAALPDCLHGVSCFPA